MRAASAEALRWPSMAKELRVLVSTEMWAKARVPAVRHWTAKPLIDWYWGLGSDYCHCCTTGNSSGQPPEQWSPTRS